jgi:hypothetical protein
VVSTPAWELHRQRGRLLQRGRNTTTAARWSGAQGGGRRSGFGAALTVSVRAEHGREGEWRTATPASSTPYRPPSVLASSTMPTASSSPLFIGVARRFRRNISAALVYCRHELDDGNPGRDEDDAETTSERGGGGENILSRGSECASRARRKTASAVSTRRPRGDDAALPPGPSWAMPVRGGEKSTQ